MCEINNKLNRKSFTGYKLVTIKDGRFYSVVTGVEYIAGKAVTPITMDEISAEFETNTRWAVRSILDGMFYNEQMVGKTSVFEEKSCAEYNHNNGLNETIVKMTISEDLHKGVTNDSPVVVGSFIKKITLLKD